MKIFRLAAVIGIPIIAFAQAPQVAVDACKNEPSGSYCSFKAPQRDVVGTCLHPPTETRLVCVPEEMRNRLPASGQQGQRPPTRHHTINQSDGKIKTIKADTKPISRNKIEISIRGNQRILNANGISRHLTGRFPNSGNPNSILIV